MTQKFIEQISRIFKDKDIEHASKKTRPKSQQIPSERLLVSYDTFLEKMKKYESANEIEKEDRHLWFKSISKAKKWRKRRFTNPFHHNEKEDKQTIQSCNVDLLDRFMKPSVSEKTSKKQDYIPQQPELSQKIEIGSSLPISYSTQSLYPLPYSALLFKNEAQPRSSTSLSYNSLFSKSTPHFTSWTSDQETEHTLSTSHLDDQSSLHSFAMGDSCNLQQQQSGLEPNIDFYASDCKSIDGRGLCLADYVKEILGDAILIADLELELGILTQA